MALDPRAQKAQIQNDLITLAAECRHDPLRFVKVAFPWGKTGDLAKHDGPDLWQTSVLNAIATGILNLNEALKLAISSGHGVGKSSLVSWIILWAITTMTDTRGVVTANTESQLRTKTWAELAKWHRLSLWNEWFELTATAIHAKDDARERTWRIDAVPWSERNTEAFAGLHNQNRRLVAIFDESGGIPDIIFETTEGALTDQDTEILWLVCGNPTRNTGRFRECWGKLRHRWKTWKVDSRASKFTNKTQIKEWIADYGEDSDFVRVRVRGEFPRAGSMQFIGADIVDEALARRNDVAATFYDPFVMGVDVARFGDDQSVICFRRGRDTVTVPWIKLRNVDTMVLAARIADEAAHHKPDMIFIDEGGVGGGVVDRCRALKLPVVGIHFNAKADRSMPTTDGAITYANKRAEMWGVMRDWLRSGAIPNDQELLTDLVGVEYGYTPRDGRDAIILEKKEDMKKRGLASPDLGDALALTFAYPVQPSNHKMSLSRKPTHQVEHDPMAEAWAARIGL